MDPSNDFSTEKPSITCEVHVAATTKQKWEQLLGYIETFYGNLTF